MVDFIVVPKSGIGINIRVRPFVDEYSVVHYLQWIDEKLFIRPFICRHVGAETLTAGWSSAPHEFWTQCFGQSFCSLMGGPSNTTVS